MAVVCSRLGFVCGCPLGEKIQPVRDFRIAARSAKYMLLLHEMCQHQFMRHAQHVLCVRRQLFLLCLPVRLPVQ